MPDPKATIEYDENGHVTKISYSNGYYYEFDVEGHITYGYMPNLNIEWLAGDDGWWFKWNGNRR